MVAVLLKLKTQNQQLKNTLKQLHSYIKALNSCDFVKIIKMFSKNFPRISCSEDSSGTFSAEHVFFEHLLLDTCFIVN